MQPPFLVLENVCGLPLADVASYSLEKFVCYSQVKPGEVSYIHAALWFIAIGLCFDYFQAMFPSQRSQALKQDIVFSIGGLLSHGIPILDAIQPSVVFTQVCFSWLSPVMFICFANIYPTYIHSFLHTSRIVELKFIAYFHSLMFLLLFYPRCRVCVIHYPIEF